MQNKTFDEIKKIDDNDCEYWEARELMTVLNYAKWENFHKVIKQAMISCRISQQEVADHFPEVRKPIIESDTKIKAIVSDWLMQIF
ncbi:MAG: hypothetical protein R3Y23_07145 [Bacillota bacterium]